MGFYIRKSFKIGPVKLNLSKSGIGTSVGVKGLRLGRRPNGSRYLHGGRYGLYYRKELGKDLKTVENGNDISPNFEEANGAELQKEGRELIEANRIKTGTKLRNNEMFLFGFFGLLSTILGIVAFVHKSPILSVCCGILTILSSLRLYKLSRGKESEKEGIRDGNQLINEDSIPFKGKSPEGK